MYRHILLPTDGSEVSIRAVDAGIELAKWLNARVYALHVILPFQSLAYMTQIIPQSETSYTEESVRWAEHYLGEVREKARQVGIPCDSDYVFDKHPCDAILRVAQEKGCDLIIMGSHGWRGFTKLLLGSETQKVLVHSQLPVLVCH
ncbi:universal stress protein [Frateuria terrea]|uniref:Universal stress protein n=1 Tax=Frateuria terrea TaxID=529704 RepID=A0A1H6URB1_9GAMM|nr:universal stress protein [Frateuria terrea]SEI94859.1 Nucleotide-binding universal stress protein, UspA family [Frateuria terrea]SFP33732.1 Nucleotide-binding universal stress protein, UspA family [Frateuria terrea]